MKAEADIHSSTSKHGNDEQLKVYRIVLRMSLAFVFYGLLLFVPAGSLQYFPGWMFLAAVFGAFSIIVPYMYINYPQALKRRMKRGEKSSEQKIIIACLAVGFYGGIIVSGLDYRFGWSQVPFYGVVVANLVVGLSILGVTWVSVINEFAGATIEVEKGQKLVTTGLYAWVRHPMYFFILLCALALPIGLGSLWAFPLVAVIIPITLHFRMLNEEAMLHRELDGYTEYCKQVRSRVIPGIW